MLNIYKSVAHLINLQLNDSALALISSLWVCDTTDAPASKGCDSSAMAAAAGIVRPRILEKLIGSAAGIDSRGRNRKASSMTDRVLFCWVTYIELRWGKANAMSQVHLSDTNCYC